MRAEEDGVPDLLLEQYALGELSSAEKARIQSRLESDGALRARLAELEASDASILAEAPPAEIAAAIRRRMLSSSGSRPGRPDAGAVRRSALAFPAAAAILVLFGAALARGYLLPSVGDLTRPKGGGPGISVYRKAPSGIEELRDGTLAEAGELLQVKYAAGGERYGAIYSIDGRKRLTRHFPAAGESSAPRLAGAGATLSSAYELDDAPGFERFFIVGSKAAFELAAVEKALGELAGAGPAAAEAAPLLPSGLEWKSFLLRKAEAGR
jgi:hypothetical protein